MEQHHVLLFCLIICITNAMKCEIGYSCSCSENYELVNCIDVGIRNMSMIKFNERYYESVKILNLQKKQINTIDWEMLNRFKTLELVNLKNQDDELCFSMLEYNLTNAEVLNDCVKDAEIDINVVTSETETKTVTINPIYKTILYKIIGALSNYTSKPTTLFADKQGYVTKSFVVKKTKIITDPIHSTTTPETVISKTTTGFKKLTTMKLLFSTRRKFPLPARHNPPNTTTVLTTTDEQTTVSSSTTPDLDISNLETDREMVIAFVVSISILLTGLCGLIWYILQFICKFRCCRCGLHFCVCFKKKPEHEYVATNLSVPIDNISFDSLELFSIPKQNNRRRKDS